MSQSARVRAGAAKVLAAVIGEGRSLSDVLPGAQAALGSDADRRLLGALVYGSLSALVVVIYIIIVGSLGMLQ